MAGGFDLFIWICVKIPRYLSLPGLSDAATWTCDVLVLGSGIAGLCAALAAAESAQVLLVCKGGLHDSNTFYAQGGIAAPAPDPEDPGAHVEDTLRVACGLADRAVVERIIRMAPGAIEWLIQRGVAFDRTGGELARTREGGHSRSRVLHARGDATGLELSAVLSDAAREAANIRVLEHHFVVDLVTRGEQCVGVTALAADGAPVVIQAGAVILATGGAGEVYRHTTNPPGATSDGAAMALRAGVVLRDMEFVQFHPTALHVGAEPLPLMSEALRGEGALLRNRDGHRFMPDYHPDGELAPRDVVSRAIFTELARSGGEAVLLDVTHWPEGFLERRFPNIRSVCIEHGIFPSSTPIPVRPAAHYMIGGLKVDEGGRTSLAGLYACGEAASSGMHGANRLASNSLLEALVLGDVCGRSAVNELPGGVGGERARLGSGELPPGGQPVKPGRGEPGDSADVLKIRGRVRVAMWEKAGIIRSDRGLGELQVILEDSWRLMNGAAPSRLAFETSNIITTAMAIASAARYRPESRGVHYREDYPSPDDAAWRRHIELSCRDGDLRIGLET